MTTIRRRALDWCQQWNQNHPWDHNTYHHRWILRQLPDHVGTALDVGCGTGHLVNRLALRAEHVTGLDTDQTSVDDARRLTRTRLNVDFRCADLLTARLAGGYDVVTALAVLHHVPLELALTRLQDLLAPRGTLIVLGLYRAQTPADHALSALAVPLNLAVGWATRLRRRSPQHPLAMTAPTTPATTPLSEVRDVADHCTPGARVRRHLFWRYSLRYTAATPRAE